MSISRKLSLGAAMLAALVAAGNARAAGPPQQVAQVGTATGAVTLPEVVVRPRPRPQPSWYNDPYTSGHALRPSSLNHIPYQHFQVPVGYDSNLTMHPYTSRLGPCIDASAPGKCPPVPSSHYEQAPFNR